MVLKKKYLLFIITSHSELVINEFLKKEKIDDLFTKVLGRESAEKRLFCVCLQSNNRNRMDDFLIRIL